MKNAFYFVFRRKDQIERMGLKELIVDDKKLKVDHQLLFQRLLILTNNSDYSMDDLLKYKLSAQPTVLFDKHGLLHPANKPQLADALPSTPSDFHDLLTSEQQICIIIRYLHFVTCGVN